MHWAQSTQPKAAAQGGPGAQRRRRLQGRGLEFSHKGSSFPARPPKALPALCTPPPSPLHNQTPPGRTDGKRAEAGEGVSPVSSFKFWLLVLDTWGKEGVLGEQRGLCKRFVFYKWELSNAATEFFRVPQGSKGT